MTDVSSAPALSIRQPWAWLILHASKDVENRTWPSRRRGTLQIHTGQTIDRPALAALTARHWTLPVPLPTGCLLGAVDLVDVHHSNHCGNKCSPWAEPGHWHWHLVNPRPFDEPVPCRGRLGLWTPTPAVATP